MKLRTDPERYGQQFSESVQVLQVADAKLGLCTKFIGLGDLPDPGIELESPALAGRFFTTEPPGKPTLLQ